MHFMADSFGALLLAIVLGAVIGYHPTTPRTVDRLNEADMPKIFIMYAFIGAVIGVTVREFGMVIGVVVFGIGGLIRFRTDTGSTRDTGRLIVVTLAGLIAGLGLPHFAVITTVFAFILIYAFDASPACRVRDRPTAGRAHRRVHRGLSRRCCRAWVARSSLSTNTPARGVSSLSSVCRDVARASACTPHCARRLWMCAAISIGKSNRLAPLTEVVAAWLGCWDRLEAEEVARERRRHRHWYDRLLMLADGVFAIAITFMATYIAVPDGWNGDLGGLWSLLASQLNTYATSFLVISIFWLAHRRFMSTVLTVDAPLTVLTLVMLGLVALLPPATRLISLALAKRGPSGLRRSGSSRSASRWARYGATPARAANLLFSLRA